MKRWYAGRLLALIGLVLVYMSLLYWLWSGAHCTTSTPC